MNKIFLLIAFTFGFIACNSKQTPIDNLAVLTKEIQNESAEPTLKRGHILNPA